jgi:hypothetical protein
MSAKFAEQDVDLQMINGHGSAAGGGVKYGEELMHFAGCIASRDETELTSARDNLQRVAGPEVVTDAAAVAANFQRMVRIADSTGIPLDPVSSALSKDARESLNLESFQSASNTPPVGIRQRLQGMFIRAVAPRVLRRAASKSIQ